MYLRQRFHYTILRARIGKSEESEKRQTKLENQNNRRIGTELWLIAPVILFPDVLLIGPFWVLTYSAGGERGKGEWERVAQEWENHGKEVLHNNRFT